ncbi:MAG: helix-turn-helix transcriptional regulator [bacterium]|nr:helix-turn-helix transcriptional regulator [bacterium]
MRTYKSKKLKIDTSSREMARLGKYLERLRIDLDMSLQRSARFSRISPAHLWKIENGTIFKSIGIDILSRLSRTYNIPLCSILAEAGFTAERVDTLPKFSQYLRQKYNLPPQAIRDLETTKEVVIKKYGASGIDQTSLF